MKLFAKQNSDPPPTNIAHDHHIFHLEFCLCCLIHCSLSISHPNSNGFSAAHGPTIPVTALRSFDSIIQIQTSINVQRTSTREFTRVKQRAKRQAARPIEDENSSDAEPTENFIEEPTEEPLDTSEISLGRKRQALEEVTNTTKRRRAPRAPQPTVAQVQESYGPRYRTRRSVRVAESSGGNGGKENRVLERSGKD